MKLRYEAREAEVIALDQPDEEKREEFMRNSRMLEAQAEAKEAEAEWRHLEGRAKLAGQQAEKLEKYAEEQQARAESNRSWYYTSGAGAIEPPPPSARPARPTAPTTPPAFDDSLPKAIPTYEPTDEAARPDATFVPQSRPTPTSPRPQPRLGSTDQESQAERIEHLEAQVKDLLELLKRAQEPVNQR